MNARIAKLVQRARFRELFRFVGIFQIIVLNNEIVQCCNVDK